MTAQTYMPAAHCVVCINLGKQTSATRRVKSADGWSKDYRVCDVHADLVERSPSIQDALREVRRHGAIGGVA